MATLVLLSAALLLGLLLPSSMANNILYAGDTLNTSQSLTQGGYTFIMQSDCNLVLDDDQNQALWTSATNGLGDNCFANLQTDGNLVINNDKNEVVWSTNTAGEEDQYILFLHHDGHINIYKPIWTRPNNDDNSTNRKIAMVTNN
ncbi:mannose-specific lectin-like [Zingiber officinale]|nr:mannose-specific lectin-like [Zingiber officinale]